MMPERIGTIGNTQGVNARPSPARKNTPIVTQMLEPVMTCASFACSVNGSSRDGSDARSVTAVASGSKVVTTRVVGG